MDTHYYLTARYNNLPKQGLSVRFQVQGSWEAGSTWNTTISRFQPLRDLDTCHSDCLIFDMWALRQAGRQGHSDPPSESTFYRCALLHQMAHLDLICKESRNELEGNRSSGLSVVRDDAWWSHSGSHRTGHKHIHWVRNCTQQRSGLIRPPCSGDLLWILDSWRTRNSAANPLIPHAWTSHPPACSSYSRFPSKSSHTDVVWLPQR